MCTCSQTCCNEVAMLKKVGEIFFFKLLKLPLSRIYKKQANDLMNTVTKMDTLKELVCVLDPGRRGIRGRLEERGRVTCCSRLVVTCVVSSDERDGRPFNPNNTPYIT